MQAQIIHLKTMCIVQDAVQSGLVTALQKENSLFRSTVGNIQGEIAKLTHKIGAPRAKGPSTKLASCPLNFSAVK